MVKLKEIDKTSQPCTCTKESRFIDCPKHGEIRQLNKHLD